MKSSLFLTFVAMLFALGCGGEEDNDNLRMSSLTGCADCMMTTQPKEKIVFDKSTVSYAPKNKMTWRITDGCSTQMPFVAFYDIDGTDVWGPYGMVSYMWQYEFALYCATGHRICYGGWLPQYNYYDCSQAPKTGVCAYVFYNEEYRSWGCGKNCWQGHSKWDCYECLPGPEKNKVVNCGD